MQKRTTDLQGANFLGFMRALGASRIAEQFFAPTGVFPDPLVEVTDVLGARSPRRPLTLV